MKNILIPISVSILSSILTVIVYDTVFNRQIAAEVRFKDRVPARFASNINESPSNYPDITNVNEFTDAASKSTPAVVHIKSPGKGDNNELPFQNAVRLEVSGIRKGDDSRIKARIKQKLEQVSPTDGTLPAYIVVVEFSNPLAFIVKK
jgi:hypothetical protein